MSYRCSLKDFPCYVHEIMLATSTKCGWQNSDLAQEKHGKQQSPPKNARLCRKTRQPTRDRAPRRAAGCQVKPSWGFHGAGGNLTTLHILACFATSGTQMRNYVQVADAQTGIYTISIVYSILGKICGRMQHSFHLVWWDFPLFSHIFPSLSMRRVFCFYGLRYHRRNHNQCTAFPTRR